MFCVAWCDYHYDYGGSYHACFETKERLGQFLEILKKERKGKGLDYIVFEGNVLETEDFEKIP
jgi:hypothetical protein